LVYAVDQYYDKKKWKDLVDVFIRQYKFNMDMSPDRLILQVMEKDNKEFIREYTQKWSEAAVQVNPSLLEKGMINLFANTFKATYFEYLWHDQKIDVLSQV